MKVYHLTSVESGNSIEADGFRDNTAPPYMTRSEHKGVWVSDIPLMLLCPLDDDDVVCFEIEVPEDALAPHEWIEEGKRYREFLVPSAVLNERRRRRLSEEELDALPWW
jgi:hypothetical protein